MPQIDKDYIDTGKLKYVFMDLPLPMHKLAFKAAEAANCAGDQEKFWPMHDRLFLNQNVLVEPAALIKNAEALGLDMPKFNDCLETGKFAAEIKKRMAEAQKAGITGTPTFLLGFSEFGGKVRAVKKFSGAQPYAAFKNVIESALSQQK
jgi:protein-disulfide isomerase